MTDIIERLDAADISGHGKYSELVRDAKAEIARLQSLTASLADDIERHFAKRKEAEAEFKRLQELADCWHRMHDAEVETSQRLRALNTELLAAANAMIKAG